MESNDNIMFVGGEDEATREHMRLLTTIAAPTWHGDDLAELYAAIASVQGAAGSIPKTGTNREQGYKFSTLDDILQVIRPLLDDKGLSVVAWETSVIDQPPRITGNNKPMFRARVVMRMRIAHAPSKTWCEVGGLGEGEDTMDKATYKANTNCRKYMLTSAFSLASNDDAEHAPAPEREPTAEENAARQADEKRRVASEAKAKEDAEKKAIVDRIRTYAHESAPDAPTADAVKMSFEKCPDVTIVDGTKPNIDDWRKVDGWLLMHMNTGVTWLDVVDAEPAAAAAASGEEPRRLGS